MAGSTPRKTTCLKVSGINGPAMGDVILLLLMIGTLHRRIFCAEIPGTGTEHMPCSFEVCHVECVDEIQTCIFQEYMDYTFPEALSMSRLHCRPRL